MENNVEQSLQKFADVVVKVGLNLQPGQELMIRAPLETAPVVRLVAERAYKNGAPLVHILWEDDGLKLARFRNAPRNTFDRFWDWYGMCLNEGAKRGAASLAIYAEDPDLLKDQDPKLIASADRARLSAIRTFAELQSRDAINWTAIGAAIPGWAAKVFPGLPPDQQMPKLWQAIFSICRVDQPDPQAAWKKHLADLAARRNYLDEKSYKELQFRAPGTDLTVGLPAGHVWSAGQVQTGAGLRFVPNMPTDEMWTLPDRTRVDGTVRATKPLSHAGKLIDDFSITLKDGRVVEARAGVGEQLLRDLVDTDEGSSRLGEVSLVPMTAPVARSGIMFFNTLYDENAACHLALGRAYRFNLKGGDKMSDEEFNRAGGNTSLIHIDFMISSPQTDVDGITASGAAEPILRHGEWAFDV